MDRDTEIQRLIDEYYLARDLRKQLDSTFWAWAWSLFLFFWVALYVPPLFVFYIPICLYFWFSVKPDIGKREKNSFGKHKNVNHT